MRAHIASQLKIKIGCTASVDDDTMTGNAKAPIMSVDFTGTRKAA